MMQHLLSRTKYEELNAEFKNLETVGRKELSDRLNILRDQEYSEDDNTVGQALEEKDALESRIVEIREILANAKIIDEDISHQIVEVGSYVEIDKDGDVKGYNIVDPVEIDLASNQITTDSPMGKALLGKKEGDTAELTINGSKKSIKIVKIK